MKKRFFSAILLICALCLLSACGTQAQTPPAPAETSAPAAEPTPAPAAPDIVSTLPGTDVRPTEAPEISEAPVYDEAKFNAAYALIGEDVALLYDAIGEPQDSFYVTSCLNLNEAGEDGELYYEGFTVTTYRVGEKEIVQDVNVNVG